MKVGFSMVFIGGAKSAPPPGPNVKSEYPGPDRVKHGQEKYYAKFDINRKRNG